MLAELVCLTPRPMARLRLVIFPFAGGGAFAMAAMAAALPGWIEPYALRLPGRETLARTPFLGSWEEAVAAGKTALAALPPGPMAFYGHSMGALFASDIAATLARPPRNLLFGAPARSGADFAAVTALSDREFLANLRTRLGGLPAALDDPDIAEIALPILRADIALLAQRPSATTPTPDFLLLGSEDPVTPHAEAAFPGTPATIVAEAGHFFPVTHPQATAEAIATMLG